VTNGAVGPGSADRDDAEDARRQAGSAAISGERAGGGRSRDGEPTDDPGDYGAYAHATPEQLLVEVRTVRRQARRARHAYWFPLVLFGLLISASVPFYIRRLPANTGIFIGHAVGPSVWRSIYLGGFGPLMSGHTAFYWLAAMLAGLAATAVWYRLRGDRVGLRTPSRGFVISGLVLLGLALAIPVLATHTRLGPLGPGELLIRGTFPLVLIGVGLCVLAWAERSIALGVIAAGYLALSLVASLYNIENVFYRLGWTLGPAVSRLPNVVLPALVLLLSGAGAWVVQRRYRPPLAGPAFAGPDASEQAS
jgi:hypothetical protein